MSSASPGSFAIASSFAGQSARHDEIEPPAPTWGSSSRMIVDGTMAAATAAARSTRLARSRRPVGNARMST